MAESLGLARVCCRPEAGRIDVEAVSVAGEVVLPGWTGRPTLLVNGMDVSSQLRERAPQEWLAVL